MAKVRRSRKARVHHNPHDFKHAKTKVLKRYAKRHSLRKGTRQYNAYVYGSVSHRMAHRAKGKHAK